jgi:phage gpG-like protein
MAGIVMSVADLAQRIHAQIPNVTALDPVAQRTIAQVMISDIQDRFRTSTAPDGAPWKPLKFPRPGGGDRPLQDTGRLQASFSADTTPTSVTVGTAFRGAGLLNFGGTVVPKKAKFLSIPLTIYAKRAGSPRNMRGTKDMPLFAKRIGGVLVGHYLLVKKAVVPARPFLGISERGMQVIENVLLDLAAKNWMESSGG